MTQQQQTRFQLCLFFLILLGVCLFLGLISINPSILLFGKKNVVSSASNMNNSFMDKLGIIPYIWPEGIGLLCDIHDDIEVFTKLNIDQFIHNKLRFNNIQNGDIIFLYLSQLNDFIDNVLPKALESNIYFSLITNVRSDASIVSLFSINNDTQNKIYNELVKIPNLLYWFSRNYDNFYFEASNANIIKYYDKFHGLPMGFDFVLGYINKPFLKERMGHSLHPNVQYQTMYELLHNKEKTPMIENRENKVYVDPSLNIPYLFGYNKYKKCLQRYYNVSNTEDIVNLWSNEAFDDYFYRECSFRSYMFHIINQTSNIFVFGTDKIEQFDLLQIRNKYRFLLSPLGNGLDCYRTWEGILFGMIVIVRTSPLDILYKTHKFPVVIVNKWTQINQSMLHIWYQQYEHLTYFKNAETRYKMTNSYWINYVKQITINKLKMLKKQT